MKTFSLMSTPDKKLTLQAYQQLGMFYIALLEPPDHLSMEMKYQLTLKSTRLLQLVEVLEKELLSE